MPSNITLEDVNKEKDFANVESVVDVAYDEAGNRLWYSGLNHSGELQLTRIDLLGGGYRTGLNGEALFPVKDLQGSIRGYVNKAGLKSAFGYRPYGTTVDLARYASDSDERWQGKDFDGEYGKYYFGARYYDPFFGMWISPDPAGQFANPYSYGGDPLNYIDPTGMWALGLGLVVGYDSNHGWSFGVGAAAEIGDVGINASLAFNQDGSKSLNLGANASIPVFNTGWWINVGTGFNLNSYMGASLSYSAGACYGASTVACAGVEVGQGFSWDRSGGFNGMTVYAEAYVTYAGVRTSVGGETGFFGAEGRGLYAGIGGYGLHAQVSQNGGASWGFQKYIANGGYHSEKGWSGRVILDELFTDAYVENPEDEPWFQLDQEKPSIPVLGDIWFLFFGGGALGTNYVGATDDDKVGEWGVTGDLDRAAYWHDKAYLKEIGGLLALFNCKAKLVTADYKLAARSIVSVFTNQSGGYRNPFYSLLTAALFGTDAVLKTGVRALILDQRGSPLQGLWR